jgi:hypothetical protein
MGQYTQNDIRNFNRWLQDTWIIFCEMAFMYIILPLLLTLHLCLWNGQASGCYPLKHNFRLNNIYKFSSYLTENTVLLHWKINWLIWENISIFPQIHMKHTNTLYGINWEFLSVEEGGIYSNHCVSIRMLNKYILKYLFIQFLFN